MHVNKLHQEKKHWLAGIMRNYALSREQCGDKVKNKIL